MKRAFLYICVCCLCLEVWAQSQWKPLPEFEGIWQRCLPQKQDGNVSLQYVKYFKVFTADQQFSVISMDDNDRAHLVVGGYYGATSDSTYQETIQTGRVLEQNSTMKGKESVLKFHFNEDKTLMICSYTMPNGHTDTELWKRVTALSPK